MSSFPIGVPALGALSYTNAQVISNAIARAGLGMTGNVYYCDPVNGLDGNPGNLPSNAVQTLAAGYALLTSGNNDVLVLIGNGASTGSARITTFTWAKSACHLIGVCAPSALSQRARIANPTTSGLTITANFFIVSGSGCLFQNISWFVGAGAGQTGIAASICLTVTGQRNAFVNCDIEGMGDSTSAVSSTSRNILLNGGGENIFSHCNIGLDTVIRTSANASVELQGGTARNSFEGCTFLMWSSDGLQYFLYGTGASCMDRWVFFRGCNFMNSVKPAGGTACALAFSLPSTANGQVNFDATSGLFGVTAIGDATTKALTYVSGGTATNGVKGVVAT
jgi:hypothetical protein